MANEWKVTEYNSTETDTQSNGDKTVYTTTMTESNYTYTTASTSNGSTTTTTSTATVNMNEMTIEKDGTWTSTRDISSTSNGITQKLTTTTSGTWAFVGKTKGDEFKKNERVMFNTLSETNTQVVSFGGSSQTTTSTDTYMTGENVMIYTVTESKGKELALEAEMGNSSTTGSSTNSTSGKTTIKLAEK
ncbi:hypothetical protein [Fluviicola sp.]|uniref:hypothetical protein n=1 Tax=Fluviicola sp. TaxID=1917219 RepID=UPI0031E418E5